MILLLKTIMIDIGIGIGGDNSSCSKTMKIIIQGRGGEYVITIIIAIDGSGVDERN